MNRLFERTVVSGYVVVYCCGTVIWCCSAAVMQWCAAVMPRVGLTFHLVDRKLNDVRWADSGACMVESVAHCDR